VRYFLRNVHLEDRKEDGKVILSWNFGRQGFLDFPKDYHLVEAHDVGEKTRELTKLQVK
jgi:hypothetical protein